MPKGARKVFDHAVRKRKCVNKQNKQVEMLLKVLPVALLVVIGEAAYSGYQQHNQEGILVPHPLPYYPIKPPATGHYPDYPEVKPAGRPRRPRDPIQDLPLGGHRDAYAGQPSSTDELNSHYGIGPVYENEDEGESESFLDTHDWLAPSYRFPGELRSAAFAFPVYIWKVKVRVGEVIADVPYVAIQAIRYRQGVNTPLPEDYIQVVLKHPAQIVHVNVKPEMNIRAHEELFTYVPIKKEIIDLRQYKRVEQEVEDEGELPGVKWMDIDEAIVKATKN